MTPPAPATHTVVDASALVEYLLRTPLGERVERAIRAAGVDLHVPALCDIEIAAVLRAACWLGGSLPSELPRRSPTTSTSP